LGACRIPGHHRKSCPIRSLYSPVLTPHYNEAEHDGDDIEPKNRRERCRKRHPRDSGLPPVQQFQKIRQCERGHCRRSNDDEDEKKGVENGPSNGIRILLIAHVSSNLCYRAEEELRDGSDRDDPLEPVGSDDYTASGVEEIEDGRQSLLNVLLFELHRFVFDDEFARVLDDYCLESSHIYSSPIASGLSRYQLTMSRIVSSRVREGVQPNSSNLLPSRE